MLAPGEVMSYWSVLPFLTAAVGFFAYYFFTAVKVPVVAVRPGPFQRFLDQHVPLLQKRYWPAIWCLDARAQLFVSAILRGKIPLAPYHRELFQFSDGGQVALDWLPEPSSLCPPVITMLLAGVTGDSQTDYLRSMALAVAETGAVALVANYRGRAGLPLTKPWVPCVTETSDLAEVIEHLKVRFPNTPLLVVGISLGGILLGQYLVEEGEKATSKVQAAMLVSPGFHIASGMASMESTFFNRSLNRHLVRKLCAQIHGNRVVFEARKLLNVEKVLQSESARDFDSQLTAPLYGFQDAEMYYEAASLGENLLRVKVPLLALSAFDDPFQPPETIPLEIARRSSHVAITLTARGSHMAFLENGSVGSVHLTERLLVQFQAALAKHGHELALWRDEEEALSPQILHAASKVRPQNIKLQRA